MVQYSLWLSVNSLHSENRTVACFDLSMFWIRHWKKTCHKCAKISESHDSSKFWWDYFLNIFFDRSTFKGLESREKGARINSMTDFNENYALLCAIMDAVIVIQVCVSLKISFRHLIFFFFNLKLTEIFPFRVELYGHGLRYMEFFPLWKIWTKITPAEYCPE